MTASEAPRVITRRGWISIALVLTVLAAVIATVAYASPAVRRQLSLSFTRQPDHFAELFFRDPSRLPSHYTTGQTLPVGFGVTNVRSTTQRYQYAVRADVRGGVQTLKRGTLSIGANATRQLSVSIVPPRHTTKITVRLLGQQRLSVHFLLSEEKS